MKFLHTSDWHIGRQLHNHSLLDDQKFVLQQIIDLADNHEVDCVVIAGDIYDRSVPPANAVALLDDVLNQLVKERQIPVIMIAGNHDGHERLGFASRQLAAAGLHIIGPLVKPIEPIEIKGKSGSALFYGLPYADPVTVRHEYDQDVTTHEEAMAVLLDEVHEHDSQGRAKIVVSHCFLDGGDESDSERPLSIGGADRISPQLFSQFDYVALGHLHGPQYKGAEHIRYSGSILKYSFSEENQRKSVTLVELANTTSTEQKSEKNHADNNENARPYALTVTQLPLVAQRNVRIIEGQLAELLEQGKTDPQREDYIMVRLLDTHAILDAMGKLRAVYPNVLHLERTGLMAQNQHLQVSREHMRKGEQAMFNDFFEQIAGEPLNADQQQVIEDTIREIHDAEAKL